VLVLTRRLGETLVLDGGIVVTIVKIGRDKVRVGIEAPADTRVLRGEAVPYEDRPSLETENHKRKDALDQDE
jgi:carbon storage regulator